MLCAISCSFCSLCWVSRSVCRKRPRSSSSVFGFGLRACRGARRLRSAVAAGFGGIYWTSIGRPGEGGFKAAAPSLDGLATSDVPGLDVQWTSVGRPTDVREGGWGGGVVLKSGTSCTAMGAAGAGRAVRTIGCSVVGSRRGGPPAGARRLGTGRTFAAGYVGPGTLGLSLIA